MSPGQCGAPPHHLAGEDASWSKSLIDVALELRQEALQDERVLGTEPSSQSLLQSRDPRPQSAPGRLRQDLGIGVPSTMAVSRALLETPERRRCHRDKFDPGVLKDLAQPRPPESVPRSAPCGTESGSGARRSGWEARTTVGPARAPRAGRSIRVLDIGLSAGTFSQVPRVHQVAREGIIPSTQKLGFPLDPGFHADDGDPRAAASPGRAVDLVGGEELPAGPGSCQPTRRSPSCGRGGGAPGGTAGRVGSPLVLAAAVTPLRFAPRAAPCVTE
jgi:hypothetical protein